MKNQVIKNLLIIFFILLSYICKSQEILIDLEGVKLEVKQEYDHNNVILYPVLINNSKNDIYIDSEKLTGFSFKLGNVTYINFGSMIKSLQHPYLPLEANVVLTKVKQGEKIKLEQIRIDLIEDSANRLRIGFDFVKSKKLKRKIRRKESIELPAIDYKSMSSYSYILLNL